MKPTFGFGDFPLLRGTRVDLCELDTMFAEDVFGFRGDPVVQLYNSVPHKSLADTVRFIDDKTIAYRQHAEVTWGVRLVSSQRVVGTVSMVHWDGYHRRAEIGYELAKDCWGKGLAQEAISMVIQFGFERLALNRIEIWTSTANLRSIRLAERLGFTRDGSLRRRILEDDGQFHDCAVYGLLRSDWSREGFPG